MPAMKTTSGLMQKLGNRLKTAHAKHANDETTFSGGGELPAGIENGVAQLVECKFGTYEKGDNQGEFYFYAAGIVVSPVAMPDGLKVAGLRTSIMEPLCDTPTRSRATFDDHLAWIYNELRKLGVNTAELDPSNLEAVAEALKQAKPYFSFRTWKGQKATEGPYKDQEPRVQHQWNGLREFNEASGQSSGVEDNTLPEPESKPIPTTTKSPTTKQQPTKQKQPTKQPEPEPQPEFNEFQDLDSLLEAAEGDDGEEAIAKLTEMAIAAGASEDEVTNSASWADVVEMIKNPRNAPVENTVTEAEPEEEEWNPSVGDVYKYQPMDPKTKKPAVNPKTKKPLKIEVEVTKVDPVKHLVDVKNLDDGKTKYTGVAWEALESAE